MSAGQRKTKTRIDREIRDSEIDKETASINEREEREREREWEWEWEREREREGGGGGREGGRDIEER